jgi:dienelactone hydrolase
MRGLITVAVLAMLLPVAVRAGDVAELPGLLRQPLSVPVTMADGQAKNLDGLVTRPDGPGPFPLVLITTGLPRQGVDILLQRPQLYSSPAIIFAQHGYAAVVVLRSGYGRSGGTFLEKLGPCNDRNYLTAGQQAGADVLAAITSLRKEPWVDPDRVLLVGHSMGGFAVLAASATNPQGVVGAISFAGAVGSNRPDEVCQPERLIDADTVFGRTSRVPSLWIFARNDHFFGPALARQMFDAYVSNGAPASLFMAPDFGRDGHMLIMAPADAAWWPPVAAFLQTLHLPTRLSVTLPPLPPLTEPAALDAPGRQAFAVYAPSRSYEKAFATDPAGHYGMALGQRTQLDAEQAATKDCQRMQGVCTIYAVGNQIMLAPAPHLP